MAATAVAAPCDVAVAVMPAPTASKHRRHNPTSPVSIPTASATSPAHTSSTFALWELPWQRPESPHPAMSQSPSCRLPQRGRIAAPAEQAPASIPARAQHHQPTPTAPSHCGSCHGSDRSRRTLRCCSRRHAGSHSEEGSLRQPNKPPLRFRPERNTTSPHQQHFRIVGAAMAATGVAPPYDAGVAAAAKPAHPPPTIGT